MVQGTNDTHGSHETLEIDDQLRGTKGGIVYCFIPTTDEYLIRSIIATTIVIRTYYQ